MPARKRTNIDSRGQKWRIEHNMNIHDSLIPPELRQKIADGGAHMPHAGKEAPCFGFGAERVDRALGRERLPHAVLHEVQAASRADGASAAAFCLLLAERSRLSGPVKGNAKGNILWAIEKGQSRQSGFLYPPGLVELGIDPASVICACGGDSISVLRAGADAVRSGAVGAVIIELHGKKPRGLDMTAMRRLALFARDSGVTVFLLRGSASAVATTAYSRWQVAASPSQALEANAPGHPVFEIKLLRHRRGIEGLTARLEWKRETRIFAEYAPDIGAVPALPVIGKAFAGTRYREQRRRA